MASIVIAGDTSGSVTISAPAIAGTPTLTLPTTSGTIVTTGGATSLTTSGNLTFTGTGNRITGDFSNATIANRVAFQTSTTNGNTVVGIIPNGTATQTQLQLFSSPDYTNYSRFAIQNTGSSINFLSDFAGTNSYLPVTFNLGGSERLRIDTSGNVGIGTSSPDARLTVIGSDNIASTKIASFYANNLSQGIYIGYDGIATTASGQPMRFTVGSTAEAMRISSAGDVAIGSSVAGSGKLYTKNDANQWTGYFENGSASLTAGVLALVAGRNTTNNTFKAIVYYNAGAGVDRFIVQDSGNVQNTNNSYGAISDIKVKENIVDATPKLADLCKVKVRQYNLKSDPTHKQIGVVAQELEEVFPKLVEESIDTDKDGNSLGTTTKAVKYSVFVPMLIKAVQELNAKVEAQAAEIAALKGAN